MNNDALSKLVEDTNAVVEADRRVVEAVAKSNLDALESLVAKFRDKWVQGRAGLTELSTVDAETQDGDIR